MEARSKVEMATQISVHSGGTYKSGSKIAAAVGSKSGKEKESKIKAMFQKAGDREKTPKVGCFLKKILIF